MRQCMDVRPPPIFRVPPPPPPPYIQLDTGCGGTWEESCLLIQALESDGLPWWSLVALCVGGTLLTVALAAVAVIYLYKYRRKRQKQTPRGYQGVASEQPFNHSRPQAVYKNVNCFPNTDDTEKPPLFLCYASEELELFHPEYQALPIANAADHLTYNKIEKRDGKALNDQQQQWTDS